MIPVATSERLVGAWRRKTTRPASSTASYAVRLARHPDEVRAALALRYEVFNLELNQGRDESHLTGLDEDQFDAICDHLIVEHLPSQQVVGTYRLQTGGNAERQRGYFCEQEFEFEIFKPLSRELVELGKACIHRQHRNQTVLGLLWRGIAGYVLRKKARYLFGCTALPTTDAAVGATAYADLCRHHLIEPGWRTRSLPAFECPLDQLTAAPVNLPRLLRGYLSLGAKICGPPALDHSFKTIDFLTLLDLAAAPRLARHHFLR